ncbi:GAF and ANTAR domain-containing protein [Gordonia tangerina]|uniref:GAF and ANTAR domain-containing protein n=1 Tax=Gordonia tangerina TaxID=2911060 RepID=A0ABS9DL24_9ACTN|nr:GAF and ANTAR domain-containing protein [Gordonia tangerina]MCF3938686.1 GAF and ANTAR domain-containing protein [Gordonia tangerina]
MKFDRVDSARLQRQIADLMERVQRHAETDVSLALDDLAVGAAELIPGAQYAAVTVTTEKNIVDTPASTHCNPAILDDIQHSVHEGPYLQLVADKEPIRIDDLAQETRWPTYCRLALERTPIRSLLKFPLAGSTHTLGALTVCADNPHAFDEDAFDVGHAYATHASLAWDALRRKEQFAIALATRDIIGQAKGIIMERYRCSADHAFGLLKKLSQESNRPLRDVARQLVDVDAPVAEAGDAGV